MSDLAHRRTVRSRAFRRAATVTVVVRGANVLALIALTPILVRELGTQGFGVLGTLTATGLVVGSTTDLGIASALVSMLAATPWESERTRALLSAALRISLTAATAGVGVAAVVTLVLPWSRWLNATAYGDGELRAATFFSLLGVALTIGTSLGQRIDLARQRGHAVGIWMAVASVAGPVAAITAGAFTSNLAVVVAAYSLPAPVVYAFETVASLRAMPSGLRPRPGLAERRDVRELTRAGAPFFALSLILAAAYQTDTLIVSSVLGAAVAAEFNVVARLFGVVGNLAQTSLMQLWSAFSEALHGGDVAWTKHMLVRTTVLVGVVSAVASGVLLAVGAPLIEWWLGDDLRPPFALLAAVAAWTVYASCGQPLQMFLSGALMQRAMLRAAVPFAVLNLTLSIALTHELGSPGPVVGSLVANVVCWSIPLAWLARRRIRALEAAAAVAS